MTNRTENGNRKHQGEGEGGQSKEQQCAHKQGPWSHQNAHLEPDVHPHPHPHPHPHLLCIITATRKQTKLLEGSPLLTNFFRKCTCTFTYTCTCSGAFFESKAHNSSSSFGQNSTMPRKQKPVFLVINDTIVDHTILNTVTGATPVEALITPASGEQGKQGEQGGPSRQNEQNKQNKTKKTRTLRGSDNTKTYYPLQNILQIFKQALIPGAASSNSSRMQKMNDNNNIVPSILICSLSTFVGLQKLVINREKALTSSSSWFPGAVMMGTKENQIEVTTHCPCASPSPSPSPTQTQSQLWPLTNNNSNWSFPPKPKGDGEQVKFIFVEGNSGSGIHLNSKADSTILMLSKNLWPWLAQRYNFVNQQQDVYQHPKQTQSFLTIRWEKKKQNLGLGLRFGTYLLISHKDPICPFKVNMEDTSLLDFDHIRRYLSLASLPLPLPLPLLPNNIPRRPSFATNNPQTQTHTPHQTAAPAFTNVTNATLVTAVLVGNPKPKPRLGTRMEEFNSVDTAADWLVSKHPKRVIINYLLKNYLSY